MKNLENKTKLIDQYLMVNFYQKMIYPVNDVIAFALRTSNI